MTPADSRHLKRRVSAKPAHLDSGLQRTTSAHWESRKNGGREGFKRVATFDDPGGEKRVLFEKLRLAHCAWKRSTPGVHEVCAWWRVFEKGRGPRHGESENFHPKTMSVGYDMRQYRAVVAVLTVFRRSSRLLLARRDNSLRPSTSALVFFLRPAFPMKKHRANTIFYCYKEEICKENGLS